MIFRSLLAGDFRQFVASSLLVLENTTEQPETKKQRYFTISKDEMEKLQVLLTLMRLFVCLFTLFILWMFHKALNVCSFGKKLVFFFVSVSISLFMQCASLGHQLLFGFNVFLLFFSSTNHLRME